MKKLLQFILSAILSIATFFTYAQTIPNASFENWSNGLPIGWGDYGLGQLGINTIVQSSDASSGTSSVKITIVNFMGSVIPGLLITNDGNGLPTTSKPLYLNGYIKSNLASADSFILAAAFMSNSNNNAQAGGEDMTHTTHATWTPFHVSLNYPPGFSTDSFGIAIILESNSTSSYVMIDNLSFSNTSIGNELGTPQLNGINDISAQNINSSIYPNPTNANAEIDFSLTSSSNINIKIYDVTGRLVKAVLNEKRYSGVQKVQLNLEELQNGIYFYTITGDGFSETKKFIVSK